MKNIIIIILLQVSFMQIAFCQRDELRLTFDSNGKLRSPLPTESIKLKFIEIEVKEAESIKDPENPEIKLFRGYIHTLKNLLEVGEAGFFLNILNDSFKTKIKNKKQQDVSVIDSTHPGEYTVYDYIIDELIQELENLVKNGQMSNESTASFNHLRHYARVSLGIPCWTDDWKNNNQIDKNKFIPSVQDMIKNQLEFIVKYYDADGQLLDKESNQISLGEIKKISMEMPQNTNAVGFELRQINPIAVNIERIINDINKPPRALKVSPESLNVNLNKYKQLFKQANSIIEHAYNDCVKIELKGDSLFEGERFYQLQNKQLLLKESWYKQVKESKTNIGKIIPKTSFFSNDYFYSFLWLGSGEIIADPFDYLKTDPSDTEMSKYLKDRINELGLQIEKLNKKIELLEKISFSPSNDSQLNNYLDSYGNLTNKKDSLSQIVKRNEGDLEAIRNNWSNRQFKHTKGFRDNFLYKGIVYVAPLGNKKKSGRYVMKHYNALNNYNLMNQEVIREIREDQVLKLLAHNESSSSNVSVDFEFESVPEDKDFVAKNLGLSQHSPSKEIKVIVEFVTLYNQLQIIYDFVSIKSTKFFKDQEANYVTKDVTNESYIDVPPTAPAMASYTIKSDGKDVAKGEYRINKLYRFGLKTGAVYSFLDRHKFEIQNNQVLRTTERHGLDAIFGVQYFLNRQDIRSFRFGMRPHLFLGMGLSGNIIKNWYPGLGLEPWNGFAILAGRHIGETDQLIIRQETLTTRKAINGGWYFSLAIDLNVFKKVFDISSVTNPFRTK